MDIGSKQFSIFAVQILTVAFNSVSNSSKKKNKTGQSSDLTYCNNLNYSRVEVVVGVPGRGKASSYEAVAELPTRPTTRMGRNTADAASPTRPNPGSPEG